MQVIKSKQHKTRQNKNKTDVILEEVLIETQATHTLASSRPRSFTGVPDLGETKQLSESSSKPIIRPGHHDPFLRRTQTNPPTDGSIAFVFGSPELPISPPRHTTLHHNPENPETDLKNQSQPSILKLNNASKHHKNLSSVNKCHALYLKKSDKKNPRKSEKLQPCMQPRTLKLNKKINQKNH